MAKQIKNKKGFLVIQCTVSELAQIEVGALGICDYCDTAQAWSGAGYIPCVLGHKWYCKKCYGEFIERATNYPEDPEYELHIFNEFKERFQAAKLWAE